MSVCCVLSGRGLCDELITRPEESYRVWCVVVCDLETLWMKMSWPTGGCYAKRRRKKDLLTVWSTFVTVSCLHITTDWASNEGRLCRIATAQACCRTGLSTCSAEQACQPALQNRPVNLLYRTGLSTCSAEQACQHAASSRFDIHKVSLPFSANTAAVLWNNDRRPASSIIAEGRWHFFLNDQTVALINQIYSVINLHMFRASSLPIIRSFLLYIRHW